MVDDLRLTRQMLVEQMRDLLEERGISPEQATEAMEALFKPIEGGLNISIRAEDSEERGITISWVISGPNANDTYSPTMTSLVLRYILNVLEKQRGEVSE